MKRALEEAQLVSQLASQLSSQIENFTRQFFGEQTTDPLDRSAVRGATPAPHGTARTAGPPGTSPTPPQLNSRPLAARGNPLGAGPGGGLPPVTPRQPDPGAAFVPPGNRRDQPAQVFGAMDPPILAEYTRPAFHRASEPTSHARAERDEDRSEDAGADDDSPLRFDEEDLKRRTELKVEEDATAEEMQALRRELPSNTTITRIVIDGSHPVGVKATLAALQTNLTVKTLCIAAWRSSFDPQLQERLTALLKKQTPLECLELSLVENIEFKRTFTFDQDFFEALFAHPHLQTIRIDCEQTDRVYLRQPPHLAALLQNNACLRHLELRGFRDFATLWRAIAPGLQGNRSITTLDLRQNDLSGLAPSMAALLQTNPVITSLDIESTEWKAAELEVVIDAVARSTAIRTFNFYRASECGAGIDPDVSGTRPALGEAIGKLLATNPHLESLGIQSQLDEPNLAALRAGFNANTGLRLFDPGEIRGAGNTAGAADATDAIHQLFATQSRLTSVRLRPPQGNGAESTCGLSGLERNTSVRSLEVKLSDDFTGVTSLLQNNRHITSLTLVAESRHLGPAQLLAQLETLFDAVADNTTLQAFRLEADVSHPAWEAGFALILARFDALCGRNQRLHEQRERQLQRVTAPATGIRLLNEFRRNEDANWPPLGTGEATAIASAIDSVLPQQEAQRVLDVLRFADIRHA